MVVTDTTIMATDMESEVENLETRETTFIKDMEDIVVMNRDFSEGRGDSDDDDDNGHGSNGGHRDRNRGHRYGIRGRDSRLYKREKDNERHRSYGSHRRVSGEDRNGPDDNNNFRRGSIDCYHSGNNGPKYGSRGRGFVDDKEDKSRGHESGWGKYSHGCYSHRH